MRKIGAHVSTSGGLDKAIEKAKQIGADCLQVFSGSPRMWRRTPLARIPRDKVWAKQKELGVGPIYTHALYLLNLASNQTELIQKSVAALKHDLEFDSFVKGAGVIVHLGSHQGRGWDAVKAQVVKLLVKILKETPADSSLLIENSAGQKNKLCSDLEEIRWLLDEVKTRLPKGQGKRSGWCVDTCHAFTAGYELVAGSGDQVSSQVGQAKSDQTKSPATKKATPKNQRERDLISEIKYYHLLKDLKCIHVNDSKGVFGSGQDRHENIGDGLIPPPMLKKFLTHSQLKQLPLVLEVPGLDGRGPDAANIKRLKQLVS